MGLNLIAEVGLNAVGFERGINRLAASARNQLLAAFGAISFGQFVRGTIEWASKLQDSADALGVNVELLQQLQNGAKRAGGDIEDLTKFILKMNESRQAALVNPGGPEAKAFGRLGFSSAEISNASTQAFVKKLAFSFKDGLTTQTANDLQTVGGRAAKALIAAFADQFESDAPIASKELIESLDDVGDEFADLKTTLMVDLAPAIKSVVEFIIEAVNAIKVAFEFFRNLNVKDALFSPEKTKEALLTAFQAAVAEISKQEIQQASLEKGFAARRAARTARETEAPDFDLSGIKVPKQQAQTPDELVAVGNFLGRHGSSFSELAQRQIQIAQQQLAAQEKLVEISNALLAARVSATEAGLAAAFAF